jgi:HlyD family secretion protein
MDPQTQDQVTWIARERAAISPPSGQNVSHETVSRLPAPSAEIEAPPALISVRYRRWIYTGIALVLALVAFLIVRSVRQPAAVTEGSEAAIPLVTAVVPGLSPVTSTVHFDGTIQARYDEAIGTEGETGRVAAVLVEAGDHVHRGQVLARLDDSILLPQVERLSATLDEQKANASLAQAEYVRAKGVEAAGALSAEDIEKRRAAAVTAAAEVKVAAAQLAEYQARLAHTEVRAPADGVVLTRTAEVGQIATPGGSALFRLARGGEVEMRGQVAEQDLPSLEVGQSALVHLTGSDRVFRGRVRLLGAVIDPQTRLGDIRVTLEPDPALRPGAFARADVMVGKAKRAVLPQTAILSDDRGSYVYIVNGEGRVERRAVRVADSTADGIVVSSGLDGTEHVVTTAAAFLRPGERITVAPPRTQ